jgi:tRNA(Ile)-lysidine synthase
MSAFQGFPMRRRVEEHYLTGVSLHVTTRLRQSIADALRPRERVILAVSGGLDSAVLLDAAAAMVPRERLIVATFDHGTGPAGVDARALVERSARALGIEHRSGRATRALSSEAELRDARWSFLRDVAAREGGAIATAHTADDQIETVLMRVLRDAGARGLAGLYAATDVVRPLLEFTREDVARYAAERELAWVEDPSNASRRYLRNRLRHDLLPALRRVRPSIDAELLSSARRAARWREDVETFVAEHIAPHRVGHGDGLDVDASALGAFSSEGLAILWPAIVARAGLALDRRGTARLAAISGLTRVGSRVQLSGGWEVVRSRDAFQLRATGHRRPAEESLALSNAVSWGRWKFRPVASDVGADSWSAWLPVDRPLRVRPWRAGDAMAHRAGQPARKVKRFLSDAGVTGHERASWPVVLAGDQIVWIPGIRRGDAATARSGRPGLAFVCEYVNR